MNSIDLKYSGILSSRLEYFKIVSNSPYRANFRCPLCGDSQKSKTKRRGWILEKENSGIYYCHNCGASMGLRGFLKTFDENLFNDYVIDIALEKGYKKPKDRVEVKKKPLDTLQDKVPLYSKSGSPLLKIKKISSLPQNHPARDYVVSRKIPHNQHYKLYYASKFNAWTNTIIEDKLDASYDAPRLILPFIDRTGRLFGYTGRAFDKKSLRYLTIMIDENMPKMFGLNTVDFERRYYVVEGGLDSLFIDNAVAMAGADGNVGGLENVENAVFIFDNEPRNKEIVSRMEKCLDRGYKVCIWPDHVLDKDINDMILSGINNANIQLLIDQNTFKGLEGKLRLSYWRKV
jgi:transcription elongation factor Elf1